MEQPARPAADKWVKSSRSPGDAHCVEIAKGDGYFWIRHSQDPDGPALRFTQAEWAAFHQGAAAGEFREDRLPG